MLGDGNGWSRSPAGTMHWGRFGAAGLLLRAPMAHGRAAVLMQHRSAWSHQGGTWALPGGARDSHESVVAAALREAREEAGIVAEALRVRAHRVTAEVDGGWTYTTVVADASSLLPTHANRESKELRWVPEDEVVGLLLHPAFARSWPTLRAVPTPTTGDDLPRTEDLGTDGFAWLHC